MKTKTYFHWVSILVLFIITIPNQLLAQYENIETYFIITVKDSTTNPYADKKDPEYSIKNTQISGYMSVDIMNFRVQRYVTDPKTRKECDPIDHCPVLGGNSQIQKYKNGDFSKPSFEKKYPVTVITQRKSMGYKQNKNGDEIFTCTAISSKSGINKLERIAIEIKSSNAPNGILQPLNPAYVIWIAPTGGFYRVKGDGKAMVWDGYNCKLVPYNDENSLDMSSVSFMPDHDLSEGEFCIPLLITDYKAFDDFMLKKSSKKFTVKSKGSFHSKEYDGGEYFKKIEIKLVFNEPYIELAPLEPVILNDDGLPELAPLEPYNPDLPELEPLEPIK